MLLIKLLQQKTDISRKTLNQSESNFLENNVSYNNSNTYHIVQPKLNLKMFHEYYNNLHERMILISNLNPKIPSLQLWL